MELIPKPTLRWLIAGVAMTGMAGAAVAATNAVDTTATHTWTLRAQMLQPEGIDRGLSGAFQKLNLSTDQQHQVNDILTQARQRFMAERASARNNFPALLNPGSAEFAHAVRVAKQDAVARIALATSTERRMYDVLTPAQRAQLPAVLSGIRHSHEAQWQKAAG